MDTTPRIRAHFADSAQLKLAAVDVLTPHIARAAALMTDCLLADGKILACGNGQSGSTRDTAASAWITTTPAERWTAGRRHAAATRCAADGRTSAAAADRRTAAASSRGRHAVRP